MSSSRNNSILFSLFDGDKKDTASNLLQKIGIFSFTTAFVATFFDAIWENNRLIFSVWAVGYVLGIFTFCLVGIRAVGQQRGLRSFPAQFVYVLSRVLLYIFLPAILLTLMLMAWAYLTHQWK